MAIFVFITFSGLCNQFYDINMGINFCLKNNIRFTFLYCSFRQTNLSSWFNHNFESLFDISFIKKHRLYVNPKLVNLDKANAINFEQNTAIRIFKSDNTNDELLKEINNLCGDKKFIVLKQFWAIGSKLVNEQNYYSLIKPSSRLVDIYNKLKNIIFKNNEKYNCIHYRYESDFTEYFKLKIKNLKSIIIETKKKFKDTSLKIFILTSNITSQLNINDIEIKNLILFKDETHPILKNLNYEECAFIDYMFGINSVEIYGHNKSSFSTMINGLKGTTNYYNLDELVQT